MISHITGKAILVFISICSGILIFSNKAFSQTISTANGCGSISAGRDVILPSINCGPSEEETKRTEQARQQLMNEIQELSRKNGAAEQRVQILDPNEEKVSKLFEIFTAAIKIKDYTKANENLRQIEILHADAADQLRHIADERMLAAAEAVSTQGNLATLERKFSDAADFYDQAATYTPPDHHEERTTYLMREANAYFSQGEQLGDRTGYERAISISKRVLKEWDGTNHDAYVAQLKNNLGIALLQLGQRDANDDELSEAISSFEGSLKLRRREVNALDWAEEKENLGNAYLVTGERRNNLNYLNKAVAAFNDALGERQPEVAPRDWTTTETHLAGALRDIGKIAQKPEILKEAIDKLNAAAKVMKVWRDRETSPGQYTVAWGTMQSQLGITQYAMWQLTKDKSYIEQSIESFKLTEGAWPRSMYPQDWAANQTNIANSYSDLGAITNNSEFLRKALEAQRAALEERRHGETPLQWAILQVSLGATLAELGERGSGTDDLEAAVRAFDAALQVFKEGNYVEYYKLAMRNKKRAVDEISSRNTLKPR